MKRAKLVFTNAKTDKAIFGKDIKLVDAESGVELECIRDITLRCPLEGIVTANVDIVISEIEIIPDSAK